MKNVRLISTVTAVVALLVFLSACGAKKATVPNVKYKDPETAYDLLHKAGLKVSMRGECSSKWLAGVGSGCGDVVVTMTEPQSGRSVASGSTVVIGVSPLLACDFSGYLHCLPGGKRIPIDRTESLPSRTPNPPQPSQMPDLRGKALSSAMRDMGCLQIAVPQLPPLRAVDRPHLLDNYVVVRQSPAPGSITSVSASNPPCSLTVTADVRLAKGEESGT
jgi:beta-lactam-binding protein with PASTA domain